MKSTRVTRAVTPICYLEGVRYGATSAVVSSKKDAGCMASVNIPYSPDAFPSVVIGKATEEGGTHDNGIEIVYDVKVQGIPQNTVCHLFEQDLVTLEEKLIFEGRLTAAKKVINDEGAFLALSFSGPSLFINELSAQMSDLGKSLQVKDSWKDMLGVATVSSIVEKIKSMGIRTGILSVLDDAGNNTDCFHNLIWRLFRLFHRIVVIDNPKALGGFSASRMSTILDKALSKVKSSAPMTVVIQKILQVVDYHMICTLAPGFINAKYENGVASVDTESEFADLGLDPKAGAAEHLKTNDIVYAPSMFFSPPPRCNVIFPSQYDQLVIEEDGTQNATRGIVNVTGRAQLNGGSETNALIVPEEVQEGIASSGKYFISPIERVLGIKWSAFGQGRPEAVEELKGDYMRGFMANLFAKTQFMGYKISLTDTTLNTKPIVGLPTLILSSDGRHWIAELDEMQLAYAKQRGQASYQFGLARPYDVPVPSQAAHLWFEHKMFAQDNVGSYIYPRIIGPLNEVFAGGVLSEASSVDLSIMAHLFNPDEEMTMEEMEAQAEMSDAPRKAIDNLFRMWKASETKGWFELNYGARKGISREDWFSTFLKCQHTDDWFMVGNGYTWATNSVTVPWTEDYESRQMTYGEARALGISVPEGFPDEAPFSVGTLETAPEQAFGELIPLDQEVTGCFIKEYQDAIVPLALTSQGAVNVPMQVEQKAAEVASLYEAEPIEQEEDEDE